MDSVTRMSTAEVAHPARRLPRKRLVGLLLGGAALIAAGAYGWSWWSVGRFMVSTDDAYVGGDVTTIAPKVPGFIARVAVRDNQHVHAGDLLVQLDDRDYRAALAKAQAVLAGQTADLAHLDAQLALQGAVIKEAQAEIIATDAELLRTGRDQTRYRNLAAEKVATTQQAQLADATYDKALAADQKAKAALDAQTEQRHVLLTRRAQIEAAIHEAAAERDIAQLNLGYTEIRAPIDGVVGDRSAETGAYATTGAALLSVVPAHGLWVDANFKENQLDGIRIGEAATVVADALPGESFHGRVVSLAPATGAVFSVIPAENATGNFTKIVQRVPVRIRLDGDGGDLGRLRPGLSVTVTVDSRTGRTP